MTAATGTMPQLNTDLLLAGRRQATSLYPTLRRPHSALADTSTPTDYATEVESLVGAARSPAAITGGVGVGALTGWAFYRHQDETVPRGKRMAIATVPGLLAAFVSHGLISWTTYRTARTKRTLSDTGTSLITKREEDLSAQAQAAPQSATDRETASIIRAELHPISLGVGIGASIAAGYGIYRWRNPTKQTRKWGLAVLGGFVAGGMARALTGSVIRQTEPKQNLSGIVDTSTVPSAVVSAISVVCLYGGGKYLWDSVRALHADAGKSHGKKNAPRRTGMGRLFTKKKSGLPRPAIQIPQRRSTRR